MKSIWENNKAAGIVGMMVLAFLVFGGLAYNTIDTVKINGDSYKEIIQGKELIGDILPPPEYIIESYLVVTQMANEPDRNKLAPYLERSKQLRKDYEDRHSYWGKELPEGPVKTKLMDISYKPAMAFYEARDTQFIPALMAGDIKSAQEVLQNSLTPNYEKHRAAIDELVALTSQHNGEVEAAATSLVALRTLQLLGLGALIMVGLSFLCWSALNSDRRRIKKIADRVEQLRGLCITNLGNATDAMKNGDLRFEIITGTPYFDAPAQDEIGQLETAINGIITQTKGTVASFEDSRRMVLSVMEENSKLTEAAREGRLHTRAEVSKFAGSYGTAMKGMNDLLDVVCTRVKTVGDRIEQLRGLCITNLGKATEAMKNGDLKFEIVTGTPSFDVKSDDEIGKLEASVNGIIAQTKGTVAAFQESRHTVLSLIEENAKLTEAARQGKLYTRADVRKFAGSYGEMLGGMNELLEVVCNRTKNVAERVEKLRGLCITNLGKATEAMKNGDLRFEIITGTPFFDVKSDDEIGKLETSVNGIITQTQGTVAAFEETRRTVLRVIDETGALAVAVRDGQLHTRGDAQSFAGSYREMLTNVNELVQGVATPLSDVKRALNQLAAQDLTARVKGHYKGEYEQLKESLNQACEVLEQSLTQVSAAADQVSSAASEINSGSQSLAQGASEQASSLEEVSSSLQEMSSMIKQNASNAKEARGLTEAARQSAERGVTSMQSLSAAVNRIKQSSDATAKIVKTIDEIAFQTNLLALNAAVEAARAGDAGKGFAVVAEEVRNLAMRSAEAAKNTAEMIEESVKNAEGGVAINAEVLANLEEINKQVNQVTEVMAEIAAASDQQSQGVEQINAAIGQMNQVTQQTAANAEESAAAAEELSGQSQEMLSLVGTFQLSQAGGSKRPRLSKPSYASAPKPMAKAKSASAAPRGDFGGGSDLIPFDDMGSDSLLEF